jgi:hypothetical protein
MNTVTLCALLYCAGILTIPALMLVTWPVRAFRRWLARRHQLTITSEQLAALVDYYSLGIAGPPRLAPYPYFPTFNGKALEIHQVPQ